MTLQRSLVLVIAAADLDLIRGAQQRVTLARPMNGADPNVVWLSIDPLASITVAWTEEFGLYASATGLKPGVTLVKMSETALPAVAQARYAFTAAAVFGAPQSGGVPAGSYGIGNEMPYDQYPILTFGLTQSATVNGVAALAKPQSAVAVLATQSAVLTPQPVAFVWLQAQLGSETVINSVQGKYTKVTFAGEEPVRLTYDPRLGLFVATPGLAAKSGARAAKSGARVELFPGAAA